MTRGSIEQIFLKAVRAYTLNTPIPRGRHITYLTALKLCQSLPDKLLAETRDGRKFLVDLKTGWYSTVYFLGEYEKSVTEIVRSLLREGDVCFDVGANFGWYTTLFSRYCGKSGAVHSFEPTPPTFAELKQNYELMGSPPNVLINNLGVGAEPSELTINVFEGLSHANASLSDQGRAGAVSYKCEIITLDSYLAEKDIGEVNFIKVDIEGSEMNFLKGAEKLFRQKTPPIWLMEMGLEQTRHFGYLPNDLIDFMRQRADYDFYRVDEPNSKLVPIEGFAKDDPGANVICFPRGFYRDRFAALERYL